MTTAYDCSMCGRRRSRSSRRRAARQDPVGAHRHAVEDVGRLHRPLLVRDDDELRAIGSSGAAARRSGRCSCRRARPRPRRADRTGTAARGRARTGTRSRRAPSRRRRAARAASPSCRPGAARPRCPGCSSSSSGSVSRSRPSPPGNSVAATSAKFASTAANVSAKRCSTVRVSSSRSFSSSSRLASRSARCVESSTSRSFSGVVLLLRERVDLAERLAAALEPLELVGELVAVVALGRLRRRLPRAGAAPRRPRPRCARARRRPR